MAGGRDSACQDPSSRPGLVLTGYFGLSYPGLIPPPFASESILHDDYDNAPFPFTLSGRWRTEIRRPADRPKVCKVYGYAFR